MKLIHSFKAIILASALAVPAFFSGNAFALSAPSFCGGACTLSDYSNSSVPHPNYGMDCYGCHEKSAPAPAPTPKPTPEPAPTPAPTAEPTPTPTTGTVTIRRTSDSCGACMIGTAPSSVSAHKNVNATLTVCSACHSTGSSSGSGGSSTSDHDDDDNESSGSTSSRRGDRGDRDGEVKGGYSRGDDRRSSRSRRGGRDD